MELPSSRLLHQRVSVFVSMTAKLEKISALYLTERRRLEREIGRRVHCRSTAGDLVQDIFLRLWEKAFEPQGNIQAYLSRCARNAAIDHIRSTRVRSDFTQNVLPEQYAAPIATPHDDLVARQEISRIDDALASLPTQTRHIFLLNRIHGRSFSEISGVLGISQRAVAKHMARAVAACQDMLSR